MVGIAAWGYSVAERPASPFSTAQAAIWERAAKLSVVRMLVTWLSIVRSLRLSASAISRLD